MGIPPKKKRCRKRKCLHCNELFYPDYRNRRHQNYCSKPECCKASKRASQRRYLSSEKGHGYFSGPENSSRVRRWRTAHPGYSRGKRRKAIEALQDACSSQPALNQENTSKQVCHPLQDLCSLQLPLLVGLIASLTQHTLQDDIARSTRAFVDLGRDILGYSRV